MADPHGASMKSAVEPGLDIGTALRVAERMREELRAHIGVSGLRLQIARAPMPLTIGLDDARAAGDAVLLLTLSDSAGDLATILISDASRFAYAPEDAAAARAVVERYKPYLREWLSRPDAT